MNLDTALGLARDTRQSVLVTVGSNRLPHATNVLHHLGDDGLIRISIAADRVKYRNLLGTPWAALHVSGENFWSYAVIEAESSLSEVAADPHDDAVEELVALYRQLGGEHPDWDEYRAAMVQEQRVVARLLPTRAYGQVRTG